MKGLKDKSELQFQIDSVYSSAYIVLLNVIEINAKTKPGEARNFFIDSKTQKTNFLTTVIFSQIMETNSMTNM